MYLPGHRQKKTISRQPICLTDSDYDDILEEIGRRDKIDFERDLEVYSDDTEDKYVQFKCNCMYLLYIMY